MRTYVAGVVVWTLLLGAGGISAQDLPKFPPGIEGELYFAPRLDLIPADQGGPAEIELDGVFDEPIYDRLVWHGMTDLLTPPGDEDDANLIFAAAADGEFLYVAWEFTDDVLIIGESTFCDVWRDDSIEVYIDALNDGPDCTDGTASCYGVDDAQLTFGADQWEKEDPDELEFGGVTGPTGACDFSAPHPEVARGVITLIAEDVEDYEGWRGEVAIALETLGNNDDGSPEWLIEPEHQTAIGFSVQYNDDDVGGDRDHKGTWSAIEVTESAWRNPGAFGKLIFLDPNKDPSSCLLSVKELTCSTRADDGSIEVAWVNPDGTDPAVPTKVLVDDDQVAEVAGDAESLTLTAEQVPDDNTDHVIKVVNCSEQATACTVLGSTIDDCGGFRLWNLLGAFQTDVGCCPSVDDIRRDYMTDGEVEDLDFEWAPGATIETDVAQAASIGIDGGPADRAPGGVPTVFPRFSADSRVGLLTEFGGQLDNIMAYAQVYVTLEEPMEVYLGVSSDDSVQVLIDGEEHWINSIGRGGAAACAPQDQPDTPVFLEDGTHSLLLKVFNGTGGWDFTFRFQDGPGGFGTQPITEGFSLSLTPPVVVPPGASLRPGDVNFDGSVNISDPVSALNHLFGGQMLTECYATVDAGGVVTLTEAGLKVLDWNGDHAHNIADAVGSLGSQFGGGAGHVLGTDCVLLAGTCDGVCQ